MPVATAPSAAFGLRLLERLGPGGVVCSPYGVRRALATAVATSARRDPPVPFDLRLDRPFLWAIEDRDSGTLLFLGRVTDPSGTSEEST
jgi:serine protease inhibitor